MAWKNRGATWVAGQLFLMVGCVALGIWTGGNWSGSWYAIISLLLLLGGAVFGISGLRVLRGNRTIFPEPKPEGCLIDHGIYSRVRHPLYTSVMLLSFAWAIWRQSIPALVAAVFLAAFMSAKSRNEEARLSRRFSQYQAYKKRTKRFLPWLF